MVLLRQLCYDIKTQLKAPKALYQRGISCLSLCLYGIIKAVLSILSLIWSEASALQTGRYSHNMMVQDGRLRVVGGAQASNKLLRDRETFDGKR